MKGSRLLRALFFMAVLMPWMGLAGCGGEVDPGTPEQLEKARQHKIKQAERYQREG